MNKLPAIYDSMNTEIQLIDNNLDSLIQEGRENDYYIDESFFVPERLNSNEKFASVDPWFNNANVDYLRSLNLRNDGFLQNIQTNDILGLIQYMFEEEAAFGCDFFLVFVLFREILPGEEKDQLLGRFVYLFITLIEDSSPPELFDVIMAYEFALEMSPGNFRNDTMAEILQGILASDHYDMEEENKIKLRIFIRRSSDKHYSNG